jgi:hypothetical protein
MLTIGQPVERTDTGRRGHVIRYHPRRDVAVVQWPNASEEHVAGSLLAPVDGPVIAPISIEATTQ